MNAVAEKRSARILNPQRMGLSEQMRQDWVVNVEEGTEIREVLDPQYWAHMASQMQQFDRIDARMETGEWMAELLVVNVGRNWAQVHLMHKHELEERSDNAVAQRHKVEWKGPQLKWCVIRIADSEIIQKELASRNAASEWQANHEKVTAT